MYQEESDEETKVEASPEKTRKKESTALLEKKNEEIGTLEHLLTTKDKQTLGTLFFVGFLFLILSGVVNQAMLDTNYHTGEKFYSDTQDEMDLSRMMQWSLQGDAGLIYFLFVIVIFIIPPTVFILMAMCLFYPMTHSAREWCLFIAIHNARGMFSYIYSFYMAFDGISVDCNVYGVQNTLQAVPQAGILMCFFYTVIMVILGTRIHDLYYKHDKTLTRDKCEVLTNYCYFINNIFTHWFLYTVW